MEDVSEIKPVKLMKESSLSEYQEKVIIPAQELKLSPEERKTYEILTERIKDYRDACEYMRDVAGN